MRLGKQSPNDRCACGSGRKHKKCCRTVTVPIKQLVDIDELKREIHTLREIIQATDARLTAAGMATTEEWIKERLKEEL